MKLPKVRPQLTARVYPTKEKNKFEMIVMRPESLGLLEFDGSKWTTADGARFESHRDAMRHLARVNQDRDVYKSVPANVTRKRSGAEVTLSKEDVLRNLLSNVKIEDLISILAQNKVNQTKEAQ